MMMNIQTESPKASRVQVRLPEALMKQVRFRTDEQGLYADSSDYIRDLIRKDAEATQDPNEPLYEFLAMGVMADESEFSPTSLDEIKRIAKEKFQL